MDKSKISLNPLKRAGYHRLKPFFRHQRYGLCAYSLPSMIVWRHKDFEPCVAIQNDAVIVGTKYIDQGKNHYLLLPISSGGEYSPEELHTLARSAGYRHYWFVPDSYIERFGEKQVNTWFTIEPQPEYDDYVYLQSDLAQLKGNRYSKKRNLINQFRREYVDTGRVKLEPVVPAVADECIEFVEAWCEERQCDADDQVDLTFEKQAALNTIGQIDTLEVKSLLLRIDGTICAFGIGSYLTDDMGVLHFEKAFSRMKGLYQYFDYQCAQRLFEGHTYINKESDMGEANLAKAKKSYYPAMMVRSHALTLRE